MNVGRVKRLLKVVQILQSGAGPNVSTLANECQVCRRTVFRDLEALRAAGIPITFDRELDRYSISSSYPLPQITLSSMEAVSLVTMAKELGRCDQLPFFEAAHSAATKLARQLPATLRRQLQEVDRSICIRLTPATKLRDKREIFQQLVDARTAMQEVLLRYESPTQCEQVTTRLRLYCLLYVGPSWYAVGRSSHHRQVWTFNVRRINSVELLHRRYEIPRNFNLDRHLRNAWRIVPERRKDYDVVIRFEPLVAHSLAEVQWHKTQRIERRKDGSVIYRARVSGLNEISWWILGFGDQAEVIQPARLRRLIARRAKNMADIYGVRNGRPAASTTAV
jgi:predicted DNA-binding transcriptional regulator YafY